MKRTILLLTALACWLLTACAPTTTVAPTVTSAPTVAPTATRVPTAVPTVTSAPTVAPTATSAPTAVPTATSTPIPDINKFIAQVTNSPHDTVKAVDGSAELLIPNGALPPGKTANDIKITRIDPANASVTLQGKPPLFAYNFEPDGLKFSTPALLRIITEASQDGATPGLVMVSQNDVSLLTPTAAAIDQGSHKLTLTAPVLHFSGIIAVNIFKTDIGAPKQVYVGDSFSALAVPGINFDAASSFSAVTSVEVTDSRWQAGEPITDAMPGIDKNPHQFTCNAPGSGKVGVVPTITFNIVIKVTVNGLLVEAPAIGSAVLEPANANVMCVIPVYAINIEVGSDPAGHAPFVGMPGAMDVNVQVGSIHISGPAPWVNVDGPLNPDGTFTAVGVGDVAGRHVIGVQFVGKLSPSGLSGDYSMGVKVVVTQDGKQVTGGLLPTGQPIIFHVEGKRK